MPGFARVGAVTHVQTNKSVEYKKRFCLLHFIARAQGARAKERERERGGKSVRKREQKVKGVKQNRWQRMKQQQVE